MKNLNPTSNPTNIFHPKGGVYKYYKKKVDRS